mgnify:CR=1 FL=1
MRVHFPELYEAHRLRDKEFLTRMAADYGLTYEEFEASNWDNEGNLEMSEVEIDNGVQMPPAEAEPAKPKRGRKPGSKNSAKKPSQAEQLEAALAFVSPVESDLQDFSQYVSLTAGTAVMYNGQMAAGHPIVEELTLSPHLEKLQAALKRCGKTLVITETEAGQLSIKGDKLRALVPCFEYTGQAVAGDTAMVTGDFNALKEAFKVCGTLASENGERVIEASLLLEPNVCTGTNGAAMLQYWHGIAGLPPGTVIPKAFAAAVAKCPLNITGIGGNWNGEFLTSVTFWFENGAWLKTQCYNDRWPSIDHILNVITAPVDVPAGLFEAIDAVEAFVDHAKTSAIHFADGMVMSHSEAITGAQYEVNGLPGGKRFNGKLIKQVSPWVKTLDLLSHNDRAFFFGGEAANPVRGVLMCMGPAS